MRPIGIDLGTTYTVVATLDGDRARVLPNAEGQMFTPSVVAFTHGGALLVGQAARLQAAVNVENTVASVKRWMGTARQLTIAGRAFAPEEIAAFILRKVKTDAEASLGERIDSAVITVPAYFDDRQRQATREAGRLAGLDVLRIINEPTAAALAYGMDREAAHTVLVWDLGGGTFDVSVLELGDGIFEVLAVGGDNRLGGDDFDQRLAAHFAEHCRRYVDSGALEEARTRQRILEAAAQAKVRLSTEQAVALHVTVGRGDDGPVSVRLAITRVEFEQLTADLLERMVPPCRRALSDAGRTSGRLDRVLLVGGATRMPAVRRLVRRLLDCEPYRWIDPDQTVALGAAIKAGVELGVVQRVILLDVLPLSLGIETQGGLVARIIPRNTPLPASETQIFTTAVDGQTAMDIHVVQGERALAADNISLGTLHLSGLPAAPRGTVKVEVAFSADADGIVHVTAHDLLTDVSIDARLVAGKQVDRSEAEALAREALWHAASDRERETRIRATVEADHTLAAAALALQTFDPLAQPRAVQAIEATATGVAEALASGAAELVLRRCALLRQTLASVSMTHSASDTLARSIDREAAPARVLPPGPSHVVTLWPVDHKESSDGHCRTGSAV
ncbi:MAG: Hsp70 family protein [Chloroflexi bacterium]|nr:Hsp70 family protein [Chloroflexota bacterium]